MKQHRLVLTATLALGLSACASIGAQDTEDMLAAAQFSMKKADTPQKLANLKAMPQYRITTQVRNGKNVYVYADAAGCQCLYVGDDAAFQNYQQMRIAKNIADEQVMAAEMNQEAMMDWGAWGPMGPGFY